MGQNKNISLRLYIWCEKQWKPSLYWLERTLCQQDGLRLQSVRREKRGNEIFQGCSLISHYMREYEESVMPFLLHFMITVSSCCIDTFHTQAFWCFYPEGLIMSKQVVCHCFAQGYLHNRKPEICNHFELTITPSPVTCLCAFGHQFDSIQHTQL